MKRPSSTHLSHDFIAYQGLSLRGLLILSLYTSSLMAILGILIGFVLGYPLMFALIGLLVGFILGVTILPKPISRLKKGKPYGYLKKHWLLKMSQLGLIKSPYVHYQGPWRRGRTIGKDYV